MTDYFQGLLLRASSYIDSLLNQMVGRILHHNVFQKIEASWRGLYFFVDLLPLRSQQTIKINVLSLSKHSIKSDLIGIKNLKQSFLFNKIYNQEYNHPGGNPFGLLLADYTIDDAEDLDWIHALANVASTSFAPLILAVSPHYLELNSYSDFNSRIDFTHLFKKSNYKQWHALQSSHLAQFIYVVLPRVMWRLPYKNSYYDEPIECEQDYLWGSAVYMVGAMIIQSYLNTNWFMQIREQTIELDALYFSMDTQNLMPISRLDATLSESAQSELTYHGFLSITESAYQNTIELHSITSIGAARTQSLTHMLPYLLCACRFVHYIKIIGRNKIGGIENAAELKSSLQNWIYTFCGYSDNENLWHYPLKNAHLNIIDDPKQLGHYTCHISMEPNCHIEHIDAQFHFSTTIRKSVC